MSAPTYHRLRDGDNPGGGPIASILVTAGPTYEYLDDVRYFANGSSGRMGYALASAAVEAGHRVVLVSGPTALEAPSGAEVRQVISALEMQAAVEDSLRDTVDLVVAVAAVADYRPAVRAPGKMPSGSEGFAIQMVPNPDILGELGHQKSEGKLQSVLVGFALQAGTPDQILELGREKLRHKNLDMIVVNHVSAMGAADNEVTLVFADGRSRPLPRGSKEELATQILDAAVGILARGPTSEKTETDNESS